MESKTYSSNSNNQCDESPSLIGEELVNFVIKTSESLHNVILRAKNSSQQMIGKRKYNFKRKHIIRTKSMKTKTHSKVSSNDKTISTQNHNNYETNNINEDSMQRSNEPKFDYELEMTSSSCEDLYDIPMEELLSSPSWKTIVEQNSFVWP